MLVNGGKLSRGGEPCRHCKVRSGYRSRGLCAICWDNVEIRALYSARRGIWQRDAEEVEQHKVEAAEYVRTVAPLPTDAMPGTPEKVEIMELRYALGFSIFHPMDRTGLEGDR